MRIIELMADLRRPLSLTEIAAGLGLASGMIYRLLQQMQERRWLMQDPATQKYSLSLRLYSYALSAHPQARLLEAARLPLQDLAIASGQSCHLSLLVGEEILVVAVGDAPNPIRLTIDVGSRHSAVNTSSGRLLIALLAESEWLRFAKIDKNELRDIAAAGYVVSHHRNLQGVHDLVVPLRLPQGFAALALNTLEGNSAQPVTEYLQVLKDTAISIEKTLGISL
jgi:DNA-binding IclR family transcriptional regulator